MNPSGPNKTDLIKQLQDTGELCDKLSQIIHVSSIPTFVIDRDHVITHWNKACETLTGKTVEEMVGSQDQWMAFYAEKRPVMADLIVDRASEKEIEKNYAGKYRQAAVDGAYEAEDFFPDLGADGKWLFFTAAPLTQKDGTVIGAVETLQDVSYRKKAEQALRESETQYRALTENVADGVILVQDQSIIFTNRAFNTLFGVKDSGHLKGENIADLAADEFKETLISNFEKLISGELTQRAFEIAGVAKDGRRFWVSLHVNLIRWQDKPAVLSTVTDVTESRKQRLAMQEETETLRRENIQLRSAVKDRYRFGDIIGKSDAMQRVYERIIQAAKTDAGVIIHGESGTGKELVARAIHQLSPRKNNRFVPVNCGAIPDNLIESEFFGYARGAFTGATHNKKGYLDMADTGSIFLDEVGEIPPNMQVKLLRAIEEGGFTPIGGDKPHQPDIRIIAATNKDLTELVKQGGMRKDFFFRINIIPINLPPLRERLEDLPLLVDHYLKMYGRKKGAKLPVKILEAFLTYDWPGNVRELQNQIYRFSSLEDFDFLRDLPNIDAGQKALLIDDIAISGQEELGRAVETLERRMIADALEKFMWHRGKAAAALNIDRKTLYAKIKKYNLLRP